jgi:putative serine/threonine protein kinase
LGVSIEELKNEPYASAICYPRSNPTELNQRLSELNAHGITKVDFIGKNNAFSLPILGKGFVGIVVKAYIQKKVFAVKFRRVDSSRKNLNYEAKMLMKANSVQVGPKFQGVSKNCLLMQYIEGDFLPSWINSCLDKLSIKRVFMDLLDQCYRLDKLGLDHGELSKAPKHIIIKKNLQSFIIDFETASTKRNVSNLTSICQFLFFSYSEVGRVALKLFNKIDRDKIIDLLRIYKKEKSIDNYNNIIQACGFK